MKAKVMVGLRILLGLVFLVFGTNGLMMVCTGAGFIPMPPPPEPMVPVMTGFMASGYLMPLVFIVQTTTALMLLSGCFVSLALAMLVPLLVNIVGLHAAIDLQGLPMGILLSVIVAILIHDRWADFKPLFACKSKG